MSAAERVSHSGPGGFGHQRSERGADETRAFVTGYMSSSCLKSIFVVTREFTGEFRFRCSKRVGPTRGRASGRTCVLLGASCSASPLVCDQHRMPSVLLQIKPRESLLQRLGRFCPRHGGGWNQCVVHVPYCFHVSTGGVSDDHRFYFRSIVTGTGILAGSAVGLDWAATMRT